MSGIGWAIRVAWVREMGGPGAASFHVRRVGENGGYTDLADLVADAFVASVRSALATSLAVGRQPRTSSNIVQGSRPLPLASTPWRRLGAGRWRTIH
jgi:hypothetical protein